MMSSWVVWLLLPTAAYVYAEPRTLEERCHLDISVCYRVVDREGLLRTHRRTRALTVTQDGAETNISVVYLKKPFGVRDAVGVGGDSRFWRVDHSHDPYQQATRGFILLSFAFQALPILKRYTTDRVLVVGINGGSASMYLRFQRPMLNITVLEEDEMVSELSRRWFGLISDATHTVCTGPLDVLLNDTAQDESDLFSVIYLDSLHPATSLSSRLFAEPENLGDPVELLLGPRHLAHSLLEQLKDTGVLILHVRAGPDQLEQFKEVLSGMLVECPGCASLLLSNGDLLLACSRQPPPPLPVLAARFHLLAKIFRFRIHLHFETLSMHIPGMDVATVVVNTEL